MSTPGTDVSATVPTMRQRWATGDTLTFEEMLQALLLIDDRWYRFLLYDMARLIRTTTHIENAPPVGQAIIHYHIAGGEMQAKVSDQGAASSDKAFELFNLSKNDHLTESISVEARARLGKTIVVRRATCKKVLSLHGQREADKPLPPHENFLYFYDTLKEMHEEGTLLKAEPQVLQQLFG